MPKFRKKPVVVEAIQWTGFGKHHAVTAHLDHYNLNPATLCAICKTELVTHGWISTLEGGHIVCPDDWIITGIKGERYPCKPDIFAATYEAVRLIYPCRKEGA